MVPEILAEQFELLADAPNGVEKLRELVLQLAVRGRLVQQDAGDEPASILIERIRLDKERFIEQREIKRVRKLPPANESEQRFSVPSSWSWCRLGDIARAHAGFSFKSNQFNTVNNGVPLIRIRDILNSRTQVHYSGEYRDEFIVETGDYLIGMDGNFNVACWKGPRGLLNQRVSRLQWYSDQVEQRFVTVALQHRLSELQGTKAYTTVDHLSGEQIEESVVPVPPLAEQRRIVAKADELMALCDELEERQRKRAEIRIHACTASHAALTSSGSPNEFARHWARIRNHFDLLYDTPQNVQELRQVILQLAVQGNLLKQNPGDEPASKILKRIENERLRLLENGQIPDYSPRLPLTDSPVPVSPKPRWEWARLGDIISLMDSGWSPKCDAAPTTQPCEWGVLKTTAVQPLRFDEGQHKRLPTKLKPRPQCEVKAGDLLITRAGPRQRVGISCVVEKTRPRLMISDKLIRFHLIGGEVLPRFVILCLNVGASQRFLESQKTGMAASQMNIPQERLRATPIPVAPTNEQRRIVAKVDRLMAICDELESKLTQSQADSGKLMEAVVAGLLNGSIR